MALIADAGLLGMGRRLGEARLGAVVLAGSENGATCLNGMPVAPGAVRMLGRLGRLQVLEDHPLLARHVAIIRCTTVPNAAILISEHYEESIEDLIFLEKFPETEIRHAAGQIAEALCHLHEKRVVAGTIDVSQVLVVPRPQRLQKQPKDDHIRIRLARFGLPLLSDDGRDLATPIGSAHSLSPERLLTPAPLPRWTLPVTTSTSGRLAPCSRKADVWSYGVVLLQMITGVVVSQCFSTREWLALMNDTIREAADGPRDISLFDGLARSLCEQSGTARARLERVRAEYGRLVGVASDCLRLRPKARPTADEVLCRLREDGYVIEEAEENWSEMSVEEMERIVGEEEADEDRVVKSLPIDDVFFLWTLSGASVEKILLERAVVKTAPPVLAGALVAVEDLQLVGNEEGRRFDALTTTTVLPMRNLREKVRSLNALTLLHSLEAADGGLPEWREGEERLPVVVKEKDVSYQAARMSLLAHLLASDSSLQQIQPQGLIQAAVAADVPPLRRAGVWRALLGVSPLDGDDFAALDTVSPHTSDRQLEVDIPRCHQYEEVMTSPSAHYKLKRLLKAWLEAHPRYVYWQGLDSLAAPFLLLNFENLPMALSCMSSFIDRYLRDFFLKDNSHIIQEYLAVFNHLISFVDASLYTCLAEMDFFPELYAIPWFLTCFAHVLPLHKLLHVWDALLRAETSFPLFVGVSVLLQLRPSLIGASFNDVILLFSDLPDLQIDRILSDTTELYKRVPRSIVHLAQRREEGHTMTEYTASQLKSFCCARLSLEDLVDLVQREAVAIVDVRSPPEFHRGSIVRSINYPNVDDETMGSIRTLLMTAQQNRHPICIVDVATLTVSKKFASLLVRNGVCGVTILDGGYDAVRHTPSLIRVGSTTNG